MSFTCPVCALPLKSDGKTLRCALNHCFDIAKEGYVNLAAAKGQDTSGDSKQMCLDRRSFLECGFYSPLAEKLSDIIVKNVSSDKPYIIDAGCGEGYYLRSVRDTLEKDACFYGIDLAKEAIRLAAKSEKQQSEETKRIKYAVAGIFDLPFEDNCADVIISVFAPIAENEFARVLKENGLLIVACPGASHLYGLKSALYDVPRENEEKIPEYDGFTLSDTHTVSYRITVENEMISALFGMTPYFWKSSRIVQEKAKSLTSVETECDFLIKLYRKN